MRMIALALVALLLAATPAYAQSSRSVEWQRYDVDLALQADGSVVVTETQSIAFHGTYQQGFRTIPLDRTTGITDVSVNELTAGGQTVAYRQGSNAAGTFSTATGGNGLTINWWFPPTTDATRTFVLTYTAHGVARVYSGVDQVDWNAVYSDRAGPVDASVITLHLPSDAAPSDLKSALYAVPQGRLPREVGQASIVDARTLRFDVDSLPTQTGVEARVQVPSSVLPRATEPPWQASADRADWLQQSVAPIGNFVVLLLTLLIGVGGGAIVFIVWYSRREPALASTPARVDEPPSDLPAPLVGTLVDGRADVQDAVAALVDLGQRGIVSLEPEAGDVRVRLHDRAMDPTLRSYERVLLVALFGQSAEEGDILLSEARLRFSSAVPVLEQRLYDEVAREGLFIANPLTTRRHFARIGLAIAATGIVLAILTAVLFSWIVPLVWLPGTVLAILGACLIGVSQSLAPRTRTGALQAQRWRAFKQHLLQNPVSTGYLPYAVAFGIDRDFLKRLEWNGVSPPAVVAQRGTGMVPWIFFPVPGPRSGPGGAPTPVGTAGPTSGGAGGPQSWSDALADLLNAASGALSHGGGSGGWGGGGWGGGGGSGGGGGGFS